MSTFIYGVLPYIAFTILIGATIIRYIYGERNWTAKSSEFLDKSGLKFSNHMFHGGLLLVFVGHVMGILIPRTWTAALGIDDHMYHYIALGGGIPAGVLLLLGYLLLMKRRFFGSDRMKVNTSTMDTLLFIVLFVTILTGCLGTIYNVIADYNYRLTIGPWFRSLLALAPDISLVAGLPVVYQLHMISWMVLAILFPFTRLVHCLSFPVEYLWRNPIIYRKK